MIKLKMVVVEVEAPRWVKRAVASVMAGALALGASAVVRADINFVDFKPDDTLKADDLNSRFNQLRDAVVQLQSPSLGFVGSIKVEAQTGSSQCYYSVSSLSSTPGVFSDLVLGPDAACKVTVTNGTVTGAAITALDNLAGTPAGIKLTGPAGHYMIEVSGNFTAINGASGDRVVVATRLIDGAGNVGGTSAFGHITVDVKATNRYDTAGGLSGAFTFSPPADVNTTIRLQGANLAPTNQTSVQADARTGTPLEIRVYKL